MTSSEAVVHGDALGGAAEPPAVPVARGVEAGTKRLAGTCPVGAAALRRPWKGREDGGHDNEPGRGG